MNGPSANPLRPEDHEDLVRRFDGGERTPALLLALNRAAFIHFHAPWEKEPLHMRFSSMTMGTPDDQSIEEDDCSDLDCDVPDFELEEAQPALNPSLVVALQVELEATGRRIFSDGQGHFRLETDYDRVADCHVTVALDLEPALGLIRVRTWSDLRDETWDAGRARAACVRWNRRMPRLKAVCRIPAKARDGAGARLTAESLLQAAPCLESQEAFRSNLALALEDCGIFWRFMRRRMRQPEA